MNIYYVYQYLREDNTPYYIGKGKKKRAWESHKRSNGVQLRPDDASRIQIIQDGLTEKQAHDLECELITHYGLKSEGGILVNMTYGGEGRSPGEELRELFRQQQLGRKKPPRDPKHTENQAATTRGRKNYKTSAGLRKYYDSLPDRTAIIEKQRQSVKLWYQSNPGIAKSKAEKSRKTRYAADYDKYKLVVELINKGLKSVEIKKQIKIDNATIRKLRIGSHSILTVFPELKQLLSA